MKYSIIEPGVFVGEVVAQIKFTVLMMPNGPMKITGGPIDLSVYESEHKVENEELKVRLIIVYTLEVGDIKILVSIRSQYAKPRHINIP